MEAFCRKLLARLSGMLSHINKPYTNGGDVDPKNSNQENGFGSAKWILIKRRLDVIWPGKSVKLM